MRSVCLPRELSGFRLPRVRKVLTILQARLSSNGRAAAGIGFFSVRIWLEQKGSRSPLHNRLRPIHFINPESIQGCQPLQVTRVSLQNCNDWQEKFLDNLNLWRVHPADMLSAGPLRRVSNPQDALAACLCSDRLLRETKRDGCAATHLALNPGESAVEFDDRFYQSQAQACSIGAAR